MRFFTAVNVLLLGVATVVSALPISQSTSLLELESRDDFDFPDMFERDFDEPALYRRMYHVALHRENMGAHNEHWGLQFHPKHQDDNAHWYRVHAVSNHEAKPSGFLETQHRQMGGPGKGYDPAKQHQDGHHHTILGDIENHDKAKTASESIKGIKCTQKFPGSNCVDWTNDAVKKLHADGHIKDMGKERFSALHDQHAENVKKKTSTWKNRYNAGA